VLAAMLLAPGWSVSEEVDSGARPGFLARYVGGRLAIGARVSHSWLAENRRSDENGYDNSNKKGNFLGSLWGLDAQQRYVPSPFLEYRIVSAFGVGAAYDQVRVKTLDWGNAEHTMTAGDGDLQIRGVQVYAFGRFVNRTRVTPYGQIGFAHYWSRFFESAGWAAPGRYFEVGDTQGWLVSAGLRIALWKGIGLDGSYERLQLSDVNASAHFANGGRTKGVFPVRSDVVAMGVIYGF
jgi:hypothetical protein